MPNAISPGAYNFSLQPTAPFGGLRLRFARLRSQRLSSGALGINKEIYLDIVKFDSERIRNLWMFERKLPSMGKHTGHRSVMSFRDDAFMLI